MLARPLKEQFAAAIERLLRPIVRQLIAYGLSYPAFDRIVRRVFVEVAEREFALPFKHQTDSRVALITGINRKEIARLRRPATRRAPPAPAVEDSVVTHVIGRWMAGPPYAGPDGRARLLPYESGQAGTASFARLAREVEADIPVRSVLDELLRIGAAELLPNGDVALRHEVHIPSGDVAGKLTLLGSDPGELFTTIIHNIEHPAASRLQRKVVYDNIGAEALDALRIEARKIGEEFIRRANALLAAADRDRHPHAPGGSRSRVALAAYYFEEAAASTPPPRTDGESAPPGRIRRSR